MSDPINGQQRQLQQQPMGFLSQLLQESQDDPELSPDHATKEVLYTPNFGSIFNSTSNIVPRNVINQDTSNTNIININSHAGSTYNRPIPPPQVNPSPPQPQQPAWSPQVSQQYVYHNYSQPQPPPIAVNQGTPVNLTFNQQDVNLPPVNHNRSIQSTNNLINQTATYSSAGAGYPATNLPSVYMTPNAATFNNSRPAINCTNAAPTMRMLLQNRLTAPNDPNLRQSRSNYNNLSDLTPSIGYCSNETNMLQGASTSYNQRPTLLSAQLNDTFSTDMMTTNGQPVAFNTLPSSVINSIQPRNIIQPISETDGTRFTRPNILQPIINALTSTRMSQSTRTYERARPVRQPGPRPTPPPSTRNAPIVRGARMPVPTSTLNLTSIDSVMPLSPLASIVCCGTPPQGVSLERKEALTQTDSIIFANKACQFDIEVSHKMLNATVEMVDSSCQTEGLLQMSEKPIMIDRASSPIIVPVPVKRKFTAKRARKEIIDTESSDSDTEIQVTD